MKKIAFLLSRFPDKTKTFEINHILNALNAGYEISIFPQNIQELKDSSQTDILEHYGLMDRVVQPNPYRSVKWLLNTLNREPRKLIPYLIKSLNPLLFGIDGVLLVVFHKVVQFHGRSNFDIFHCQYGPNGLIAAWLKELGLLKGKIVTSFHGFDAHFHDPKFMIYYYLSPIRIWSPLVFKHSNLLTVNTPYLKNELIKLGADPTKIELLPMGVDTAFFLPPKKMQKKRILRLISVGRLVRWKSHDLGIKAVNNLIQEGFNLEYCIIGDGPEWNNLLRLIEKLRLKKNHIKMLGARNQSEIKIWLQQSDVFLMTSTFDESGRRETQGVVTAEAQACGLPVVAFRSGGIPFTLEEGTTGFLAEEKNMAEFTNYLRKLCKDDSLRKKMGQNARKFIEANFSNTELAKKQLSLYEKVLLE